MLIGKVLSGRERGPHDNARRFLPVGVDFDNRAVFLQLEGAEEQVSEQLLHVFGIADYRMKRRNFFDLGPLPWSVIALHNVYLRQVREAFVLGAYYPALLGACGLGERILNQLVLTLRDDYRGHDATHHVKGKQAFTDWDKCVKTLCEWGVFSVNFKSEWRELKKLRNHVVHYNSDLDGVDARQQALQAIKLIQSLVGKIFDPQQDDKYYFSAGQGRSFVKLEVEDDPFVRHFILPACALVSPKHHFEPEDGLLVLYDDLEYGLDEQRIDDREFLDRLCEARSAE